MGSVAVCLAPPSPYNLSGAKKCFVCVSIGGFKGRALQGRPLISVNPSDFSRDISMICM